MEDPSSATPARSSIQVPVFGNVMTVVESQSSAAQAYTRATRTTLRDVLAVLFRHRTLVAGSFLIISIVAFIAVLAAPRKYESRMKIMIKRERFQMVLTPEPGVQSGYIPDITQEDINSEVELLKSRDLLEKVVIERGLHKSTSGKKGFWSRNISGSGNPNNSLAVPIAVKELADALDIQSIPKSHLIDIGYKASDPQLAARVLSSLTALYLDKHLAVHNPSGTLNFFQQQTQESRKNLDSVERQLSDFQERKGVLSIDTEKDLTLRGLSDFEARLRENEASASALDQRISSLKEQIAATPDRVTSQVKTSDNPLLLQQLKTTLLNLELKRTELLTKFEPGYRLVQEVDTQIAQAQEAISKAEKNSLRDETTDLNKTHAWLDEELARAQAERATLEARSAALQKSINEYRADAQRINRTAMTYHDLARSAKSMEEKFLLYETKQEEARISEAMDRKRIVNAVVAEAPTVPAFPAGPGRSLLLMLCVGFATLVSIGTAFFADYMDATLRTPDEVETHLGLPVLASIPLEPQTLERQPILGNS